MLTCADLGTVNKFIEDRLNAILARPTMWGDALAVEMQVLLLLELTTSHRFSTKEFRKLYQDFIDERAPDLRPVPLAGRVDGDMNRLARILTEFRNCLCKIDSK